MLIELWRPRARRIAREAAEWRAEMLEPPSAEVRAAFEAWLAADPAHARAYQELGPFATLSQQLPRPAPEPRHRRLMLRPALVAVALVLMIAGALLAMAREPSAAVAAVVNPGPAVRSVRLDDGSTITLDADTALDVALTPASRTIRLRKGRARFNVAAAPNRPLRISTAPGSVTAEAGLFDVALDKNEMTVLALKGHAIVSDAASRGARSVPLGADRAVRVDGGGTIVAATPPQADRLWPAGRLGFANMPLEKVVAVANRFSKPPIRLADASLGAVQVTAVLDVRDTRALAYQLGSALDLQVHEGTNAVLLTR